MKLLGFTWTWRDAGLLWLFAVAQAAFVAQIPTIG